MLQTLRKWSKSWISSFFLGALALSFAVWGIADVFRGNVSTTVATIGSTEISVDALRQAYQRELRAFRAQTGQTLTSDQAKALGIPDATLQDIINREAMNNTAHDLGITISDQDVYSQIQSDKVFAGPLGTFDRSTFERLLGEAGYTEAGYIEVERGNLSRQQLLMPLAAGLEMPDTYLRALYAASNEMRAAQYIVLTPDTAGTVPAPSDAVLAAYEKAHANLYSTPEYRDVSYAYAGPADVMSQVQVTDAQIKKQYDDNIATYVVPEKRTLERINFPSEADAAAAKAKIDSGQTFAQVAQARGLTAANIAMGAMAQSDLAGQFDADGAKAVFALPNGTVSAPLKSPFGFTLVHVVSITPGSSKSLADATPEIRTQLSNALASAKLNDVANAYTDARDTGLEVKDAAAKAGMHYARVSAVDANGLDPSGKPAGPTSDEFRQQVQHADVGEPGDPFPAKDGNFYAIKVEGITPSKLKPLDQVRAQVLAQWTKEQQLLALKKKAEALAAQAGHDQDLANAARSAGVAVQSSPGLTRRTTNDIFSPALTAAVFDAKPGAVVTGPLGKGDGIVVARVSGVLHPTLPPDSPILQAGKQQFSQQLAEDVTLSLANDARAAQKVTINNQLVAQATGEGGG